MFLDVEGTSDGSTREAVSERSRCRVPILCMSRDSLAMDKGRAVTAAGQDRRQHSLEFVGSARLRAKAVMSAEFNPIKRNKKRPTYLNAIKAMCAHCMGCSERHLERGFRESIRNCSSEACPLHRYRPYRPNLDAKTLDEDRNV